MASLACVSQYDDRPTASLLVLHTRRACELEPSCAYFGIDDLGRLGLNSSMLPTWPAYWRKVAFAALVLQSGRCEFVIVLDADAVMGAAGTSWFRSELSARPEAAMLLSGDPPCWPSQKRFCAGVFALVASPLGMALTSAWLAAYPKGHWNRSTDGTWSCRSGPRSKPCGWAGPEYEQDAFVQKVMDLPRYRESIVRVPACQLNVPCTSRAESVARSVGACHFMGYSKHRLAEGYLRSLEDGFIWKGDTTSFATFCSPNATFRQLAHKGLCKLLDPTHRSQAWTTNATRIA